MDAANFSPTARTGHVRYIIVLMLFVVTSINYADRAALSIAGPALSKDLGLDAVTMGYIFSAFGWAYAIGQLPGGALIDRFGARNVYAWSLAVWSLFTLLQGSAGLFAGIVAAIVLFSLRFLMGLAEAPSFPANSRIVAAWFPAAERGTATAVFNSAQYFALVLFFPVMGWITHAAGWPWTFAFMGAIGLVAALLWLRTVHDPQQHPRITSSELAYIEEGGGLTRMDAAGRPVQWSQLAVLLRNRMFIGIFLGQYCISTLTYFFSTWFPVYLASGKGLSILQVGFVASVPALCGFAGGVLGGLASDLLLRRGWSLTSARKTPIVIGMLLSVSMIICNYVDAVWLIVAIMALSFFGKGFGALGWAVMSDTAPKEMLGLSGGLFNLFGNIAGITTPIVIGYLVQGTGSFNAALVFVGLAGLVAMLSYLLIVGEIRRAGIGDAAT